MDGYRDKQSACSVRVSDSDSDLDYKRPDGNTVPVHYMQRLRLYTSSMVQIRLDAPGDWGCSAYQISNIKYQISDAGGREDTQHSPSPAPRRREGA